MGPATVADDEAGGNGRIRGPRAVFENLQEQPDGGLAHLAQRLMDSGQAVDHQSDLRTIVKTGECKVPPQV